MAKRQRMSKASFEVMKLDLMKDLRTIESKLDLSDRGTEEAWAGITTFCSLSVRVLSETNMSKIRSHSVTMEISALMDGREVIR